LVDFSSLVGLELRLPTIFGMFSKTIQGHSNNRTDPSSNFGASLTSSQPSFRPAPRSGGSLLIAMSPVFAGRHEAAKCARFMRARWPAKGAQNARRSHGAVEAYWEKPNRLSALSPSRVVGWGGERFGSPQAALLRHCPLLRPSGTSASGKLGRPHQKSHPRQGPCGSFRRQRLDRQLVGDARAMRREPLARLLLALARPSAWNFRDGPFRRLLVGNGFALRARMGMDLVDDIAQSPARAAVPWRRGRLGCLGWRGYRNMNGPAMAVATGSNAPARGVTIAVGFGARRAAEVLLPWHRSITCRAVGLWRARTSMAMFKAARASSMTACCAGPTRARWLACAYTPW